MHILRQPPRLLDEGPLLLCLLPTRELAQQVEEVARDYCKAMKLSIACLVGQASKSQQAGQLKRGIDVCIATPSRLLYFLENRTTNMKRCTFLVLDEADRMLDTNLEPQIRKIVSQIRPDRQTLMFSAAWPKEVPALAKDFQKDAVFLNVGLLDLAANQDVEVVEELIFDGSEQMTEQRDESEWKVPEVNEAPAPDHVKASHVIYTDASVQNGDGGIGIYFPENQELNVGKRLEGSGNSYQCEIMTATMALQILKKWDKYSAGAVTLRTDCLGLVKSLRKTKIRGTCAKDLITLKKLASSFLNGILFDHVYGHAGNPGNTVAHKLAYESVNGLTYCSTVPAGEI